MKHTIDRIFDNAIVPCKYGKAWGAIEIKKPGTGIVLRTFFEQGGYSGISWSEFTLTRDQATVLMALLSQAVGED